MEHQTFAVQLVSVQFRLCPFFDSLWPARAAVNKSFARSYFLSRQVGHNTQKRTLTEMNGH